MELHWVTSSEDRVRNFPKLSLINWWKSSEIVTNALHVFSEPDSLQNLWELWTLNPNSNIFTILLSWIFFSIFIPCFSSWNELLLIELKDNQKQSKKYFKSLIIKSWFGNSQTVSLKTTLLPGGITQRTERDPELKSWKWATKIHLCEEDTLSADKIRPKKWIYALSHTPDEQFYLQMLPPPICGAEHTNLQTLKSSKGGTEGWKLHSGAFKTFWSLKHRCFPICQLGKSIWLDCNFKNIALPVCCNQGLLWGTHLLCITKELLNNCWFIRYHICAQ